MWRAYEKWELRKKFWLGSLNGRGRSEGPDMDGRVILEMILREVVFWAVDLFHLAQGRDRCQAVVNAVMNIRVS
jgi:hypothetical protein